MTVHSKDIETYEESGFTWSSFPLGKVGSAIFWSAGTLCTYQIAALFTPGIIGAFLAVLSQWTLTRFQSPIWRRLAWDPMEKTWYKRRIGILAIAAFLIDATLNIVGSWPLLKRLHEFPPVLAIGEMFSFTPAPITGFWAFIISLILGAGLAAAEYLWYLD